MFQLVSYITNEAVESNIWINLISVFLHLVDKAQNTAVARATF